MDCGFICDDTSTVVTTEEVTVYRTFGGTKQEGKPL